MPDASMLMIFLYDETECGMAILIEFLVRRAISSQTFTSVNMYFSKDNDEVFIRILSFTLVVVTIYEHWRTPD